MFKYILFIIVRRSTTHLRVGELAPSPSPAAFTPTHLPPTLFLLHIGFTGLGSSPRGSSARGKDGRIGDCAGQVDAANPFTRKGLPRPHGRELLLYSYHSI